MSAESQRRWRERHPDRAKEVQRQYESSEKGREAHRLRSRRRRALVGPQPRIVDPDKKAAWIAVELAIMHGDLVRRPCEICGQERSQAHHFRGYAPEHYLAVKWLCALHHAEAHGRAA